MVELAKGGVFVIVDVKEIYDPEVMVTYRKAARQQALTRGCKILARGGELFEGEAEAQSHLIQWWESEAAFNDWQSSDEYRPLKRMRDSAMKLRITLVPAVD